MIDNGTVAMQSDNVKYIIYPSCMQKPVVVLINLCQQPITTILFVLLRFLFLSLQILVCHKKCMAGL